MSSLTSPPVQGAGGFMRRWAWPLVAAATVLVVIMLLVGVPRFVATYHLYFGADSIQRLFYEDLGLSRSWSQFISVVTSFFYALAWVPLSLWTYRVLVWRFNGRQLAVAFACWVFVYGHVPLMHALLGSDVCFNQRTGAPLKWYVEDADGRITLFDSGGYDTVRGVERRPVTPEICNTFARQKVDARPRRITTNVREIEFFDPNSGRARVWYAKAADGSFDLFDARGFHPVTSEALLPVTQGVVAEILGRATQEADEARKGAQAAETERRAALEAAQQHAAAQAKQRAESEQADARRRALLEEERIRAAAVTPTCPGKIHQIVLNTTWTEINPGARCRFMFDFPAGSEVLGADWQGSFRLQGHISRVPDKVRAPNAEVLFRYSLCPLETGLRRLKWDCTPM